MNAEMIIYDHNGLQVLTCGYLLQVQADELGVDLYSPKSSYRGLRNFLTSVNQETVINVLLPNTTALSIYVDKGVVTLAECSYNEKNKSIIGPDQHGVYCERPLNNKTVDMEELKNLLD